MRYRIIRWWAFCSCLSLSALVAWPGGGWAQDRDAARVAAEYVNPDEIVSLGRDVPIHRALEVVGGLSKTFGGKVLIDLEKRSDPIGVDVVNMPWRSALETVLQANGMSYKELDDYIMISSASPAVAEAKVAELVSLNVREVSITATFFEADRRALREVGIDWSVLFGVDGNPIYTQFSGQGQVTDDVFSSDLGTADFSEDLSISSALKAFESNNIGEIIASPRITVMSGREGRVQVGTDFSIKTRDFAGNVIDNFFSTGTILSVTPKVVESDGMEFIHLSLSAERSSAIPDAVSTLINKDLATTEVLLLDGEETALAGLYSTEENQVRKGIPFLKDLPPWFLGIRYLAGYNRSEVSTKELVVVIKATLVPTLEERLAHGGGRAGAELVLEARDQAERRNRALRDALKRTDRTH